MKTREKGKENREKINLGLAPNIFILFLTFSFLLPPSSFLPFNAFAQETSEQLQNIEQYIQNSQAKLLEYQQQISSIDVELGSMAGDFDAQIAQRDAINAEIQKLREENDVLREQIAQSEDQLAATEAQFEELRTAFEQLRTRVQELMISLYKDRTNRYARILANAETFHELRVKNYFLSILSSQDVEVINQLNQAALELNTLQEQQSQIIETLNAQKIERENGEAILASKRNDVDAIVAELDSTREGRLATQRALYQEAANLENAIGNLQRDREAEIQRLQAEAEAKRKQAAEAATQVEKDRFNQEADDADTRAGNLAAPPPNLNPNYVSPLDSFSTEVPFGGMGAGKGIILRAASAGAAVKAVQPGNVIEIKRIGANDGNLVIIEHASGIKTAYAGLQDNPPVQIGQQVNQGAIIGYVGGGIAPDILKFYTLLDKNGAPAYVDPAELLNF